ncbi:membrane protein, partial [Candidatus Magnetomorum sp. HK-1]
NVEIILQKDSNLPNYQVNQPPPSFFLRLISLIKFVWLFAFSDIFPKSKLTKKLYIINYFFQRKNTQKLNMFTLIAVILFSLFFLKISYSLKNYFVYSISDPRINKVLVNRKKNTSFALKQDDLNKIASLVWVSDGSLTKKIVYEKELDNHPEYKKIRKATMGAFGSRERSLDCYLSKKAQAEYSTTASLSEIIIDIN